jgi:hypothetical protein
MEKSIVIDPKKALPEGLKPESLILIGDRLEKYRNKGKGFSLWGCPPAESCIPFAVLDGKDRLRGYWHV